MPETRPPLEVSGQRIDALAEAISARGAPPVDRWDPPYCGHSGMRIARDGRWFHDDTPIEREAMVRLFASVLRREADGRHMLVTPVEKLEIDVDNTPLRALEMTMEGEGRDRRIAFRLDRGDAVIAGPDHPLTVTMSPDGPSPRVRAAHGLEAEIARPLYYELAEVALAEGHDPAGVWSDGKFFGLDATG